MPSMSVETTYKLTHDDVREAVAAWLRQTQGAVIGAGDVKITVHPGTPYYDQRDTGTPATVEITATKKKDATTHGRQPSHPDTIRNDR